MLAKTKESITTRTMYSLVDTFQKLKEISAQVGLNINEHKSKYLRCTKKQHKTVGIDIIQTHLAQVNSFKYLGSIVNGNNSIEEEIKEKFPYETEHFMQNKDLFKKKLAWFGHIHRMPENSMVKKVYEWSPALTRSLGRTGGRMM
jgi:hypothetical protein